jgi:hypothetical protein
VRVVNRFGPAAITKLNNACCGFTVDLGLIVLNAGGGPPQRGFGAFEARGAALDGLVRVHNVLVGALSQRDAAFVQEPGAHLKTQFTLVQIVLTSIGALLPFVGDLFTTVGNIIADPGQSITLFGDDVTAVSGFGPLLLGARSRLTLATGGSR